MVMSMNCMARPKLMRKYLLSNAMTISVPPVDPLCENTIPRPAPAIAPPISTCMNTSFPGVMMGNAWNIGCSALTSTAIIVTPMIVRMLNCLVRALKAMISIEALRM